MLSRISRMSVMSAPFANGCSLFAEHPTAPKTVVRLDPYGRRDSLENGRERSKNSWSDPFIAHHEHEQFLAELSELDVLKNNASCEVVPADLPNSANGALDWNVFLDDLDWMDKFGPLDVSCPESPSNRSNSTSPDTAEDFLERTAALIDWKAWNHYLSNDWEADLNLLAEQVGDEEVCPQDCSMNAHRTDTSDSVVISCEEELKPLPRSPNALTPEIPIVPASGPLTWIPSISARPMDDRKDAMSWCSSSSTRESSPERVIKRRGVKMKPPSDEGTNHRRSLNREAAFRYRERKRIEQRERKRELEQLLCSNNILKQQVEELRCDIAEWRRKLDKVTK